MSDGMRTPAAIAFLGFLVMAVLGSRSLITHGVPAIGTFAHWPSVGDVFDTFGSAWRYTGLGSASPQPAALAVIGALGTVLFGATGLAQTIVVVAAIPLGAFGAYRLARVAIGFRGPALAAGLVYGINPVARNAIAQGRLGPLVLFALLPFLLLRVVRLGERSDARRGRVLRLAVLCRAPRSLLSGRARSLRARGAGVRRRHAPSPDALAPMPGRSASRCVASVGALVLLFPWPLAYAHSGTDKASLGFAFRPVPRPVAGAAVRHRAGVGGWAHVGPLPRGRGPAVRRHRRPPRVDRARLDAGGRRVGRRVGSRALLPAHVGPRS